MTVIQTGRTGCVCVVFLASVVFKEYNLIYDVFIFCVGVYETVSQDAHFL